MIVFPSQEKAHILYVNCKNSKWLNDIENPFKDVFGDLWYSWKVEGSDYF